MQHTISMMELRGKTGDIVDHVRLRGDTYFVERRKKTIAVITSVEDYQEYQDLIQEKIKKLEETIAGYTAISTEEFQFLVKYANYNPQQEDCYCNPETVQIFSQNRAGMEAQPSQQDLEAILDGEIEESPAEEVIQQSVPFGFSNLMNPMDIEVNVNDEKSNS